MKHASGSTNYTIQNRPLFIISDTFHMTLLKLFNFQDRTLIKPGNMLHEDCLSETTNPYVTCNQSF